MTDLYTMLNNQIPARRIKIAILALCLAASAAPGALAQTAASARPRVAVADYIVAVVNGDVITRYELDARIAVIEQRMKSQNAQLPPRVQLEKQMLERMIVDRTQLQLASELGIRIDDTLLDRAIGKIAEQNNLSIQDFRTQLARDGMPLAQFREDIRQQIALQRLREREVDNKIQITDSEVDNYLAAGTDGAQAPQQELNLAQILVSIPESASPQKIAERRQRAEDVMRQVKVGGDFAKLATTYSDSSEALSGGDLGWRSQDRLPQLFLDATADLKQGETSGIVKSPNGFHIIKLVARRTASIMKSPVVSNTAVQQTRARHILIKINQITSAGDARRKLVELKQRLDNKAANFEDLAKLFSNDLSATKGGDLGWVYPGDTVPEFERAMNALKPGEVSEPVESPFGLHLIQVVERKSDDVSKERQRLIARQVIRDRKLDEATQDWTRQVRDRAYVEYRLEEKS